jgi:undecaprenyl-diphosphatase
MTVAKEQTSEPRPEETGWRRRLFRRAGEGDLRRRSGDWVRLVVAVLLLVLAARHSGDVTASERAVFNLFNTLPGAAAPLFRDLYRLGALWAVGLVVVAALFGRRWRLARDLLVAGFLAWATARAVGQIVVAHEGIGHSVRIAAGTGASPAFPAVRIAVIVAVIAAASPYVTRPTRMTGWLLVLVLGISAMYLGAAFPLDLFAGLVLGWGVGSVVHLAFGSPGMRPTIPQVVDALALLGIRARDARLAPEQPSRSTVVLAEDDDGLLRVKVIGRDEAQARLLSKVWATVVYRDSGPRLAFSRVEQVEHEAFLMLVAAQAAVNVPRVVAAGAASSRAAILVLRPVAGPRLSDLDPAAIDDDLLVRIWENVRELHDARVVHNALDAAHVIVRDGQPWIVGFDSAVSTGSPERMANDVAELLAGTAGLVGEERAVHAAAFVLGRLRLAAALPFLQPAALTSITRGLTGDRRRAVVERLDTLREAGAEAVGIDPPVLTRLHRISATSAAMALGALVAIAVLLAEIGDPEAVWATFRNAEWSWIALAAVLSLASNVAYAIGLQGTVPVRLPLWPTTEVELGMSFSNLAVPAIGGQAMQVRFLQKVGVDLSSAVAAGGILSAAGALAASAGLFALALVLDPARVDVSLVPTGGLIASALGVAGLVALVSALIAVVPRLHAKVMPAIARAASTMWAALRSPGHVVLLIGGNVAALLLSTGCLQACLIAFGGHASFWALLAANIAIVSVASTVPIPGGGTAVGTVGLSAALVSFGVDRDVAIAAVLANQLVYYYLPAIPGWFATRHLARHDYL